MMRSGNLRVPDLFYARSFHLSYAHLRGEATSAHLIALPGFPGSQSIASTYAALPSFGDEASAFFHAINYRESVI